MDKPRALRAARWLLEPVFVRAGVKLRDDVIMELLDAIDANPRKPTRSETPDEERGLKIA